VDSNHLAHDRCQQWAIAVTDPAFFGWRRKVDYDVTYNNVYFCMISFGLSWDSLIWVVSRPGYNGTGSTQQHGDNIKM
jgi:hypothetical protein